MTLSLEAFLENKPNLRRKLGSGDSAEQQAAIIGLTGNLLAELPFEDARALVEELWALYPEGMTDWRERLRAQVAEGPVTINDIDRLVLKR